MCDFTLESHKSSQTGKWMGPSPVTTEGFIFEMKAPIDSTVTFDIDGKTYEKTVRDILDNTDRSEEHTSELQSRGHLVCRLLLEKKNQRQHPHTNIETDIEETVVE